MDQNYRPNSDVLFLASTPGMNIQLKANSLSYDSYWDDQPQRKDTPHKKPGSDLSSSQSSTTRHYHRVDIEFVGANASPRISTIGASRDYMNFYNVITPESGVHNVRTFERVIYSNLYEGIDLEFYFDAKGRAEYQFIIHPGASPDVIRIEYHGALSTDLTRGRIRINLNNSVISEHIPKSFDAQSAKSVNVRYKKLDQNQFGFRYSAYNTTHDLIIDPVPTRFWGSYFGGPDVESAGGMCVDSSTNFYLGGTTSSATNIATSGAYQATIGSLTASDIFIAKFSAIGIRQWCTYYGGTGNDVLKRIAFDRSNGILICGRSESLSGMTTTGAHQSTGPGALLAKFSTSGNRVWSTYYGNSGDWLETVCSDVNSNVIAAGWTRTPTTTLIATGGTYQTINNSIADSVESFVIKFNSTGQRQWGTYYGGPNSDIITDICTDQANRILFSGYTNSRTSISSAGSHQPNFGSQNFEWDGMLVKLSADGRSRVWGTYYGDFYPDQAFGVCVDATDNIYLAGVTGSFFSIGTTGTQNEFYMGGASDAFLAKFNSSGVRQWGTYVGGFQIELCNGGCVSVDSKNNPVIAGSSSSPDSIASRGAFQEVLGGGSDLFIMKYNPSGRKLWGTFVGGNNIETPANLCTHGISGIAIAGTTTSTTGIASVGAYQSTRQGTQDAFIESFGDCKPPTPLLESNGNPSVCLGDVERYTLNPTGSNLVTFLSPTLGSFVGPSNGSSLLIQWTATGRDTVRAIETDPTTGCYAIAEYKIGVFKGPTATSKTSLSICKGSSVNLDAVVKDGTAPFIYTWTPSDSLNSTSVLNPLAHPSTTTTYNLLVSDAHGCQSTTSIEVRVLDRPVANAGKTQSVCPGQSVTLGSPAQPNCTYQWTPFGPLNNATLAQPRATITTPTTFQCIVTNDSTHCSDTATVLVRLKSVSLSTAPDQPDFGTLGSCEGSRDTVITINNTGSDSITVISQNSTSPAFSFSDALPLGIGAGQSRSVHLRFSPTAQGQASGTIHLLVLPCSTDVAINLRGSKSDLALSANRSVVDFGSSVFCSGAVQRDSIIVLKNSGSADMTLQAPIISAPFSIVSPQFTQVVKPGATLNVTVRYQPSSAGNYSTSMRIPFSWSGCQDTIVTSLFARDIQPSISLNTQSMTFRELLGCDAPRDSVIEITNTSDVELTLDSALVSSKDFIVRSTLPMIIPAHQSVQLSIQFNPAGNGVANATLSLLTRPCDVRASVQLSGSKQGVSLSAPDTVDLGTLPLCSAGELKSTFRLANTSSGGLGLRLDAQTITDDFSTDIVIGDSIASGASRDYTVHFSPKQHNTQGIVVGQLSLRMQPCDLTKLVNFKARLTSMQLSIDSVLDFGNAAAGQVIKKQLNIINTGSADIIIDQVPDAQAPFNRESTTRALPDTLKSGDTLGVVYSFTAPADFGLSTFELPLAINKPCAFTQTVQLKANTSTRPDTLTSTIAVESIEGAPGDVRQLLVRLRREQSSGTASRPTDFKLTLNYNPNILYLLNDQQKCQSTSDNRCELQLRGQRGSGDTLIIVPARITLGNTDFDAIKLKAFSWTNATVANKVELEDGSIHVLNTCEQGGIRFYIPTQTATSLGARPNPVSSILSIEIGLAEPSNATLELVDVNGQSQMSILTNTALQAGRHLLNQDLSAIPSGTYLLRLRTLNYSLTTRIVVLR